MTAGTCAVQHQHDPAASRARDVVAVDTNWNGSFVTYLLLILIRSVAARPYGSLMLMCQQSVVERHMEDTVYDSSVTNTGDDDAETFTPMWSDEDAHFAFTLTVFLQHNKALYKNNVISGFPNWEFHNGHKL